MLERRADPIGLVEAAYDDLPDELWARNLLDAALCLVADGSVRREEAGVYRVDAASPQAPPLATALLSSLGDDFSIPCPSGGKVGTFSEAAACDPDAFYLTALDAEGRGLAIAALLARSIRLERAAKARWALLGAHLATAARLRRRRHLTPLDECVFSVAGRIEHAEGDAKDVRVCERLRAAALGRDKARTRATRADACEALAMWRPLVGGRWSLVDRFERGGRRCVVARRNDPVPTAPGELSPRERQVFAHLAQGDPMKLASYALGIDASTVSVIVRSIVQKLGARGPELLGRAV